MKLRKNNKRQIALLFGGQSTEHEISLLSSINVTKAINRQKYDLIFIGIDKHGRWILCNEQNYLFNIDDPKNIKLAQTYHYLAIVPGKQHVQFVNIANGQILPFIDVIFLLLHGANGENGSVQGLLRLLNIPHTGSDILGSAICMDKDITKHILRNVGISVTPSITLLSIDNAILNYDFIVKKLGLPLFIKPASQGSSIGVSKVINRKDFDSALVLAFSYDTKVVVEKWINGREIETAVMGNSNPKVSVCGEVISNDKFYSYKNKYFQDSRTRLIIPAHLDASIARTIRKIAKKAFLALGCSITARVDFFLTDEGKIFLNEVNTLPGFTSISMYPKLWKASGISFTVLIDQLITLALNRTNIINLNKENTLN